MRAKQALLAFRKQEKGGYVYDVYKFCCFSNMFSMGYFVYAFSNHWHYSRVIWNHLNTNHLGG